MKRLIGTFPRQVAVPYRIDFNNGKDFWEFVNKNNGIKTLYYSVYSQNVNIVNKFYNITIDRLFFDFDSGEESLEDVKKFSDYLIGNDIKHLIIFSGRKGFHLYVMTESYKPKYPKDLLITAYDYFIDLLCISPDLHIRGNTAQMARIPNSFHLGGQRFCVPITRDDLDKGMEFIKEKAKKQQPLYFRGTKLLDINCWDKEISRRVCIDIPEFNYNLKTENNLVDRFLPCIRQWLTVPEKGNWEARYYYAIYCKAICLPQELCHRMAAEYFGKVPRTDELRNNYEHLRKVKGIEYGYRVDTVFPNCSVLYEKGLCSGKCKYYKEKGSPIYG